MDSSTGSEIYAFPHIYNAERSPSGPAISGNNFNLEINLVAKHAYTCGDNCVEECHLIGPTRVYKYKSLSWGIVDRELLASDFPYSFEKVKWDGVDKILESKDDLIQQILDFARTAENVTPPFQDDDIVYVGVTFVDKVVLSPQEFELTKRKIVYKRYENIAEILWNKVSEEMKGLGQYGSSLYEEYQCLKSLVETIVRESANWRMRFDEDYERVLIESLIELSRREFMSLPAVTSRMHFLQAEHLPENELIDDQCSICMSGYLPGSEAYNMPCSHRFHFACIQTWLLKKPTCPVCRFNLPSTE